MALDMNDGLASRGWFGFSPAVAVTAAAIVCGGALFGLSSRSDPYEAAIAEVCADSEAAVGRDNAATEHDGKIDFSAVDSGPTLFQAVAVAAGRRLAALRAVTPPSGRASEHAALIESEASVVRLAEVGQADLDRAGYSSVTPNARVMLDGMRASERRYVALGVPKGCSG